MNNRQIILKKVKVHNLKNVDLTLDHNKLIVFTGVSGSGKSSLAFDTIYAEGQRRFLDTLSHSARRYLKELKKPDCEKIEGISPTIAIEQKSIAKTPRSTIGTITNIYDYLRVLFAKIGICHCPICHNKIHAQSVDKIIKEIKNYFADKKAIILVPLAKNKKKSFKEEFKELLKKGYTRVRVDNKIEDLNEIEKLDSTIPHNIDLVIDRIKISDDNRTLEAIQEAFKLKKDYIIIYDVAADKDKIFSENYYCSKCNISYRKLNSNDFSFNSPLGMCKTCQGLGEIIDFDLNKVINPNLSIKEECCLIAPSINTIRYSNIYKNLARIYKFKLTTPFKDLSKEAKEVFLYGTKSKWTLMYFYNRRNKKSYKELCVNLKG